MASIYLATHASRPKVTARTAKTVSQEYISDQSKSVSRITVLEREKMSRTS